MVFYVLVSKYDNNNTQNTTLVVLVSGAEHGLLIYLRGPLNCIEYWTLDSSIIKTC